MTTTLTYRKNGKEFVRVPRYPNEVVMSCIDIMVNSHVSASKTPSVLHSAWKPLLGGKVMQNINLPSRLACNKFRQMIPWLVRAQIGMALTKQYWKSKGDKFAAATLTGDGTEKKRQHMEGVVVDLDDDVKITFAPWPQGDKAGATTNRHLFEQV